MSIRAKYRFLVDPPMSTLQELERAIEAAGLSPADVGTRSAGAGSRKWGTSAHALHVEVIVDDPDAVAQSLVEGLISVGIHVVDVDHTYEPVEPVSTGRPGVEYDLATGTLIVSDQGASASEVTVELIRGADRLDGYAYVTVGGSRREVFLQGMTKIVIKGAES